MDFILQIVSTYFVYIVCALVAAIVVVIVVSVAISSSQKSKDEGTRGE